MECRTDFRNPYILFLVGCLSCSTRPDCQYSYIAIEKRELTVSVAFTALSLFTMLQMPLNVIPTYVMNFSTLIRLSTETASPGSVHSTSACVGQTGPRLPERGRRLVKVAVSTLSADMHGGSP